MTFPMISEYIRLHLFDKLILPNSLIQTVAFVCHSQLSPRSLSVLSLGGGLESSLAWFLFKPYCFYIDP